MGYLLSVDKLTFHVHEVIRYCNTSCPNVKNLHNLLLISMVHFVKNVFITKILYVHMRLFYANMFNEESVRLLQQRKFDKYNYKRMLQYLQFSK